LKFILKNEKIKKFKARYHKSAVRCGDCAAEFFRGLGLVVDVYQVLNPPTEMLFLMKKVRDSLSFWFIQFGLH
jgi:hypothetical protein